MITLVSTKQLIVKKALEKTPFPEEIKQYVRNKMAQDLAKQILHHMPVSCEEDLDGNLVYRIEIGVMEGDKARILSQALELLGRLQP